MRFIIFSLIALLNIIIQSTFTLPFGIVPNTSFVLVICYAVLREDVEASLFGFFVGLLQDIVVGRFLGFFALIYALIAFFSAKTFSNYYRRNIIPSLILTFTLTYVYEFVFYFFMFLFRARLNIAYYTVHFVFAESILNLITVLILYQIIYHINKKVEQREKPSRKMF